MYSKKRTFSKLKPKYTRYENRNKKPKSEVLGRISGRIVPTSTTLAKSSAPFTGVKYTTLLYENGLTAMANNASFAVAQIASNGAWDVDLSGSVFGNKQPLFFDNLLSSSGPYKQYKVISWKTTYTVVNAGAVPMNVYLLPPHSAVAEIDSVAEAENFPGVEKRFLTGTGGSKSTCTVTVTGHVDDVYPGVVDGLVGTFSANPGNLIIGGLIVGAADSLTTVTAYVAVKHEMYTQLQLVDALVS